MPSDDKPIRINWGIVIFIPFVLIYVVIVIPLFFAAVITTCQAVLAGDDAPTGKQLLDIAMLTIALAIGYRMICMKIRKFQQRRLYR